MIHTANLTVWASDGNGPRMVQDDTVTGWPGAEELAPPHTLVLKNTGANTFYVGDVNVDDDGFELVPGETLQVDTHSYVYVACASGDTSEVRVLIILD